MDWVLPESSADLVAWLESTAAGRYTVDRKLDFFATSMRDFDDVAPHLEDLAAGNEPNHTDPGQRLVDLRRASLADSSRIALSDLGAAVHAAWKEYAVDDATIQNELPRHLLLFLEAIRVKSALYIECMEYWYELSDRFGAESLLTNWDKLYALNYLDVVHAGYSPGAAFRATDKDLVDINLDLNGFVGATDPDNANAKSGAKKIHGAINGKVPRGRHRVTSCLAIELVRSGDQRVDSLLDNFGYPKRFGSWTGFSESTKKVVKRILTEYDATTKQVQRGKVAVDVVPVETKVKTRERKEAREPFQLDLPKDFDYESALVAYKPRASKKKSTKTVQSTRTRTPAKRDYVQQAESNEAVGKAGEMFVVEYEKNKLKSKPELAEKIYWIAEDDDSVGYDIVSYDLDGSEIYIEVKSTLGRLESEFYISTNELLVSNELGRSYVIYRVYDLNNAPKICPIPAPLEKALDLEAVTYKASIK